MSRRKPENNSQNNNEWLKHVSQRIGELGLTFEGHLPELETMQVLTVVSSIVAILAKAIADPKTRMHPDHGNVIFPDQVRTPGRIVMNG